MANVWGGKGKGDNSKNKHGGKRKEEEGKEKKHGIHLTQSHIVQRGVWEQGIQGKIKMKCGPMYQYIEKLKSRGAKKFGGEKRFRRGGEQLRKRSFFAIGKGVLKKDVRTLVSYGLWGCQKSWGEKKMMWEGGGGLPRTWEWGSSLTQTELPP